MAVSPVTGVRTDIAEMLTKMREVTSKSPVFAEPKVSAKSPFNDMLAVAKDGIGKVNNLQMDAEQLKSAYISGDPKVSMADVLVSTQKSKLAFEGLVTVRNKILEAYKDIMNMPV